MEYRIYSKAARAWFNVTKEAYTAYDRERTATQKRMQDRGCCNCPRDKRWYCDMVCEDCTFRKNGNRIFLDAPEGDGEISLLDLQEDGERMEDLIADRDLLDRLIKRLYEIDPDAETMIALWKENDRISDRAIARELGCPNQTFVDRIKRVRTELQKIRNGEK